MVTFLVIFLANPSEWLIDVEDLPDKYRKYAYEIDEAFNRHVPQGCCGGCI
jgi:hypothetical protein